MKKIIPATVLALFFLTACDDTTNSAGFEVMPDGDNVVTSTAIFKTNTRSIAAGHVLINTPHSYLGCVIDPETDALTRSSFLAQFHVMNDYSQPEQSLTKTDDEGKTVCDSCVLRLYFTQYYGDSLTTMKARVRELSRENIMEEGKAYYSDFDAAEFLTDAPRVDKTTTYSIYDPTIPNSTLTNSSYYRNITISLPAAYGSEILRAYYTSPQHFANSYEFIHHVCPGFYVENVGGIGNMLDVEFSTLDIYYSYRGTATDGRDTTYTGISRFAATEEVLQNTSVETQIPEELLAEDNPYTLLKSPAGIYTEITLPIDEILGGEHAKDTLNSAQIVFDQYNTGSNLTNSFTLAPPANILMLPKSEMDEFFVENKIPDNVTSFMTQYNNGSYAFNNIARLIKTLYQRRDTSEPDWNKVVLVPVDAEYTSISTLYTTTQVLTRLRPALSLSTVHLAGASGTPPQISCIYSHFE